MPGVLGHIAAVFTTQRENVATEALGYALRGSTAARGAVEALLADGCGDPVPVHRVVNQFVAGEESRPDLGIFDANNHLIAFIEGKLWASLTAAQPVEYLRRLDEAGGKALLLVVPSARVESILVELSGRARDAGVELSSWKSKVMLRASRSSSGRTLMVISWASLLGALRVACSRAGEGGTIADLEQLGSLIDLFESEGFVPMTAAELSDLESPRRLITLVDVCEKATQVARNEGVVQFGSTLRETHGWYSAGRYVACPQAGCWIGLDCEAWRRYHVSPLWVWFDAGDTFGRAAEVRRALQLWEATSPQKLFAGDEGDVYVPLFIKPGAEEDAVVADLVSQIREIRDHLNASGLPELSSYAQKRGPTPI